MIGVTNTNTTNSGSKKRHRITTATTTTTTTNATNKKSSSSLTNPAALIDSSSTLTTSSSSIRRSNSRHSIITPFVSNGFNDPSTADVILRLYLDPTSPFHDSSEHQIALDSSSDEFQIYLHSRVLTRSKYFSALLSDRWKKDDSGEIDYYRFNLAVTSSAGSINSYVTVLQLLYSNDLSSAIDTVSTALELLPIALELLYEECVTACVRYLEAVPWSEEEERIVLSLIPLLRDEESSELLARVSPLKSDLSEEMLHGLILTAINYHPNMAFAKAFVAKLLRDFSSRESARRVLDKSFEISLKVVKESLEEYSSPDFRGDHNETEAIQRLNLHTAMTNGRHLLWLIERMIELRVADTAVKEWSDQSAFTADLQRAFRDDAWRNIVPGLPAVVLRCTCKLASAVSAGVILASRQVRMKLVKDWLPVLIVCKDNVTPMLTNHKSLYLELEETFLKIISTLPMSEAQELLQLCLSFSTRNVEDCPHLVSAFTTWFRRANRQLQGDNQLP